MIFENLGKIDSWDWQISNDISDQIEIGRGD